MGRLGRERRSGVAQVTRNWKERSRTHLLSTAISFSMLLSFPLRAFLGMHLTANMRPVSRSWARTTSEKAPLRGKKRSVIRQQGREEGEFRSFRPLQTRETDRKQESGALTATSSPALGKVTRKTCNKKLFETAWPPPHLTAPKRRLRGAEGMAETDSRHRHGHELHFLAGGRTNQRVASKCLCPFCDYFGCCGIKSALIVSPNHKRKHAASFTAA